VRRDGSTREPPVIEVRDVRKLYRVYAGHGRGWLKATLLPFARDRFSAVDVALDGVSLTVHRGEIVGVLGRNGSGKSTLLKLLAGMSQPTSGTVRVRGRLRCLMSSGIGFNARLTGRQNIVFGSVALGIPRKVALERVEAITAFAELQEHIDKPTMYYSSGMRARLALAVALQEAPEVLVLDEAMSAGDAGFNSKCRDRLDEVCASGSTVLVATHSLGFVLRACTRAVLLDRGRIEAEGEPIEVSRAYEEILRRDHGRLDARAAVTDSVGDIESPTVRVLDAEMLDHSGRPTRQLQRGDAVTLRVALAVEKPIEDPRIVLELRTAAGVRVAQLGPHFLDVHSGRPAVLRPPRLEGPCTLQLRWNDNPLGTGEYIWSLGVYPWTRGEPALPATEICRFTSRSFVEHDWRRDVVLEPASEMQVLPGIDHVAPLPDRLDATAG
jgi:ABC-type polysaccharide/polyol phosphate transport system ATPase subunit